MWTEFFADESEVQRIAVPLNFESPEMKVLARLTSTSEKASLPRFRGLTVFIEFLINLSPPWESAKVAVVNEKVGIDLATHV